MKLKSPVSQVGGKHFLKRWLNEKIPDHVLYCEPFCGGAHVLFGKEPSRVEILNDINNNLITFFKVVQDDEKRKRLIQILNALPYSRRIFRDISTRWQLNDIPSNDELKACEWFYLSRTCFSGDFHRGGFAVPSRTGRNPCKTFRNITDSLDVISQRLKYVTFENLNYAECIEKYDSEDTLFFIDPPYMNTRDYYSNCFHREDVHNLSNLLNNGVEAKIMLTHYENDTYDELYKGWNWNRYDYETFKVSRGITKNNKTSARPKVKEFLYCNFKPLI